MSDSVFRYPGAKGNSADWIINQLPPHECYVELFGGSGAVLANKPGSRVEVYNDLDGDLVQFFQTLRDQPDALVRWLKRTPYSRELYEEYADAYYAGERPDDSVERAGRFFFLRCTQFSGQYNHKAGFSTRNSHSSPAVTYDTKRDQLEAFADRFDGVIIENLDWRECIEQYDAEETLFYLDPPYVDAGDDLYTHDGAFDHQELVDALESCEGKWVCSYTDLPDGLEDYHILTRETWHQMAQGHGSGGKTAEEKLVMNFDPTEEATVIDEKHEQMTLTGGAD